MSRENVERLEEIIKNIPKDITSYINFNERTREYYIALHHNKYHKIKLLNNILYLYKYDYFKSPDTILLTVSDYPNTILLKDIDWSSKLNQLLEE